jgi:hypothetical protein
MIEEFSIKDAIYLVHGVHCLDLHNDYDFTGVVYSVAERRVTLKWRRGAGDWVRACLPAEVELLFEDVSRFQVMPRDPEMPFTEDDCLSSAGWWVDEEWCDGVMDCEAGEGSGWLRAFGFQSGAIMAIAAEKGKATNTD